MEWSALKARSCFLRPGRRQAVRGRPTAADADNRWRANALVTDVTGGIEPGGEPLGSQLRHLDTYTHEDNRAAVGGDRAVERENGRLRNEWALLPLWVRRLERVQLHADLTILARVACALGNVRATPLADTA